MKEFNGKTVTYAHNDTSVPERESRILGLNKLKLSTEIVALRDDAFERRIPISDDETLGFLCLQAKIHNAKNILELGTAIGVSAICLADACANVKITTVEKNPEFYTEAVENIKKFGLESQINVVFSDALDYISVTEEKFDFIFLDSAKVQYVKYLPALKRILSDGGVIFADDVLLYGWVNGEKPFPAKRKMLVKHVREYVDAVVDDEQLTTCIVDVGNGVALSIKN